MLTCALLVCFFSLAIRKPPGEPFVFCMLSSLSLSLSIRSDRAYIVLEPLCVLLQRVLVDERVRQQLVKGDDKFLVLTALTNVSVVFWLLLTEAATTTAAAAEAAAATKPIHKHPNKIPSYLLYGIFYVCRRA